MNPIIKQSIINIIKSNLVRHPDSVSFESLEWTKAQKTPGTNGNTAHANMSETGARSEYTVTKLITMQIQPRELGTLYILFYNGTLYEHRMVYSEQKSLTPAQQDVVDIYNTFKEQFDTQLRNEYAAKMSGREMATTKHLNDLQK